MADRTIKIVVQKAQAQTQMNQLNSSITNVGQSANVMSSSIDGANSSQSQMQNGANALTSSIANLNGGIGQSVGAFDEFSVSGLKAANVATAVVAVVTAAAAAAVTLANDFSDSAIEIDNLASRAGVAVEEFQALAFATQQFGIDQGQLSDILQDVNDKVGDFVNNNGGEFKDIFEQVLEPMGYTVDQLKEMSSPQVLKAVTSGMQKLGFNTQQTTFIMEAMASESNSLTKAYAEQGAEINRLLDKYDEFGNPLTDDDIKKAREYREEIQLLNTQWAAFTKELGSAVIPLVTEFAKQLNIAVQNLNDLINKSDATKIKETQLDINALKEKELRLEKALVELRNTSVGQYNEKLKKESGYSNLLTANEKRTKEILKLESQLAAATKERSDLEAKITQEKKEQVSTQPVSTESPEQKALNPKSSDLKSLERSLQSEEEAIKASRDKRDKIISDSLKNREIEEKEAQDLRLQSIEQYNQDIADLEKKQTEQSERELKQREKAQTEAFNALYGGTDSVDTFELDKSKQFDSDLEALKESLKSEEELILESYNKRQEILLDALNRGKITQDEYNELNKESYQQYIEDTQAQAIELSDVFKSASQSISNDLAGAFVSATVESENFGQAALNIIGQVAQSVAQQLLAQQIQKQIMNVTEATATATKTTAEVTIATALAGANGAAAGAKSGAAGAAIEGAASAEIAAGYGATALSAVSSLFGLQTGGSASGNSAYEVNELGMESYRNALTKNGERDVLLTGREGGTVTRSEKVGNSSASLNVSVENYVSGVEHSVQQIDENTVKIIATEVFNKNIDSGVSSVMSKPSTKTRKQMDKDFSIKKRR